MTLGLHLSVQLFKGGDRKVDLSPHFENVGHAGDRRDAQRHAADGAHVGGDVFAHRPIATGGGSLEPALRIGEANCEAVDLQLGAVLDLVADSRARALVKSADLVLVEGVLQAEHR